MLRARTTRFRRVERVRRRPEYMAIYEQGRSMSGRLMTVFVLANGGPGPRLGIAATRKFGAAVTQPRQAPRARVFRRNKPPAGSTSSSSPGGRCSRPTSAHVEADYLAALERRARRPRGA